MNLKFYTNFSPEEYDALRMQGINLDDWDYALLTHDLGEFTEEDTVEEEFNSDTRFYETHVKKIPVPNSYHIERLLTGCCENRWYKITWEGKPAIIGFAYHG